MADLAEYVENVTTGAAEMVDQPEPSVAGCSSKYKIGSTVLLPFVLVGSQISTRTIHEVTASLNYGNHRKYQVVAMSGDMLTLCPL
jgi:hypothetical protein